jgi:predicted nuclease of predicted toxin-antitoxin system
VSPLADQPHRVLFDENLSARLLSELTDAYPDCAHVVHLGLAGASDRKIWQYAQDRGFAIVTKDEDFHRLSVLYGPPPKVIWIRLGNCSTAEIVRLLRARGVEIERFLADGEAAFLALA